MDAEDPQLQAAHDVGYAQIADHHRVELIERLRYAVDDDRALAAALRGAAAALHDAAAQLDLADVGIAVGYTGGTFAAETAWCLRCAPPEVRIEAKAIFPEGTLAEGECRRCGRGLLDIAPP